MAYPAGKLPLHCRAQNADPRIAVRNRYRKAHEIAFKQVAALQRSLEFLTEARDWYGRGYKDWTLVSAITNGMWNAVANERGLMPTYREQRPIAFDPKALVAAARGRVFPTEMFLGKNLEGLMFAFEAAALRTYGFEPRSPYMEKVTLRSFLRERLAFYEFDFKHAPLFGDPPGHWPKF